MNNKEWLDKLKKLNYRNYYGAKKKIMFLPENDSVRGYGWESAKETVQEILADEEDYYLAGSVFNELRDYHLMYYYHHLLTYGNNSDAEREFSISSAYSYLHLLFDYEFIKIEEIYPLDMDEIAFRLHQILLSGWWDESKEVMQKFIDDIHGIHTKKESFFDLNSICVNDMAWFVLRLSAKAFKFELSDSDYPRLHDKPSHEYSFYLKVVDEWDTNDISIVDKHVYMLCELHIMEDIKGETDDGGGCYDTVGVPAVLYPFAVLAWLKLREYAGLKNPEKFTHELMKYPLASRFSGILKKPMELPFVQELSKYTLNKNPSFKLPSSFAR